MKKVALLLICVIAGVLSLTACNKKSLEITKPTLLEYQIGTEEIDLTGGKVAVKQGSNVGEAVALTKDMVSYPKLDTEGKVTVTVSYQGVKGTFDITVVSVRDYITIKDSDRPFKKTYSELANKENVELRGGKLTLHHIDTDTTETVSMYPNPDVVVTDINHITCQITVQYKGTMKASFNFTSDESEVGYATITKLPNRYTYRNTALTVADVDLSGGEVMLELSGADGVDYKFDELIKKSPQAITVKAIDRENRYVTFVCDLVYIVNGAAYAGKTVEGYFDIELTDNWVTGVKISTLAERPTTRMYDAPKILDYTSPIDLTGGTATLTYNNSTTKTLPMTDSKISVIGRAFDPASIERAIISFEYKDEISTSSKITNTYSVDVNPESITNGIELDYCAQQIDQYADLDNYWYGDGYGGLLQLPVRFQELALRGYDLYTEITPKASYLKSGKTVTRAVFYMGFYDYYADSAMFGDALYNVIYDRSKLDQFYAACDQFVTRTNAYIEKFNYANILAFEIIEGDNRYTIGSYCDFMKNALDTDSIARVQAYREAVNASRAILEYFDTAEGVAPSNEDIEAAYEIALEAVPQANNGGMLLCEVLNIWRWDCVNIIYDYYYQEGKTIAENDKLAPLALREVFPEIIRELKLYAANTLILYHNGHQTRFVYHLNNFTDTYEKVTAKDYPYKAVPDLLEYLGFSVTFNPDYYDEGINPDEEFDETATQIYTIAEAKRIADKIYQKMYDNYAFLLFNSDVFMEFFDEYAPFLDDIYAYGTITQEAVKSITEKFEKLSIVQKYVFIAGLDAITGRTYRYSFFEQTCDNYYASSFTVEQVNLLYYTWSAWMVYADMDFAGSITEEKVGIFRGIMDEYFLPLYNTISNKVGFDKEFQWMLTEVITTNNELKLLPVDLYEIVSKLMSLQSDYDTSHPGEGRTNAFYGMRAVLKLRELDDLADDWFEKTGTKLESLKYNYGGKEIGITYRNLKANLENDFSAYVDPDEPNELFEALLDILDKWTSTERDEYRNGAFKDEMQSVINKFKAIENYEDRMGFIDTTYSAFLELLYSYYSESGMTENERNLFIMLFSSYNAYLYADNLEDFEEYEGAVEEIKDIFFGVMDGTGFTNGIGIIEQYQDLIANDAELSEIFENSGLVELYNKMLALYNQLIADETP